ncbi:MAG: GNAT family N-acetyltransferase [bacterium]
MTGLDGLRTLPDAVRRAAEEWPDRVGWVFDLRDGPEPKCSATLTFGEIAAGVDRVARSLRRSGIRPGDRVGVMLHNRPEFALAWLALARLGATMVPVSVKARHDDASWILSKSRSVALVASPGLVERIAPVAIPVLDPETFEADVAAVGEDDDSPLPEVYDPDGIVNVQFTSGTTGHPKGCLLSHRYWLYLARSLVTGFPRLRDDDVMLTAQPMSYMDPQWNLVAGLVSGATVVFLDGFHPATVWERLREHRATYFYCVASMPVLMLTTPPGSEDRDHAVRVIQCSAIPPGRHAELEERWGAPWFEVFGMTETGGDIHVTDEDHDACVGTGTIGRAKPGRDVRIVAPDGSPLPPGTVGELTLRGPGMMSGYDDEPEATAAAFRGGWLHTGDLARGDERGYVWLVGRLKDVVRRSGENVAAREVEDALLAHPAVRLAAVVGVPDEVRGEEVKAYVVLSDARDASAAAPDLRDHCAARIAAFKVPRYWEVRQDLPRTPSERVAKQQVVPGLAWDAEREEWADMSAAAVVAYDAGSHEAAVRSIYEASFPESLRSDWAEIGDPRGDEELLVLVDGDAVGFALMRYLGATGYAFVRYFAVDESLRGRGRGARLMRGLVAVLEQRGCHAVLLDVEDPDADPVHEEEGRRRIAFYQRQGLALLPVADYAPPDHGSSGEQVALLPMGMALGAHPSLKGETLEAAITAVMRYRYGVEPA